MIKKSGYFLFGTFLFATSPVLASANGKQPAPREEKVQTSVAPREEKVQTSVAPGAEKVQTGLFSLPDELWVEILRRVPDLRAASESCKELRRLSNDAQFWSHYPVNPELKDIIDTIMGEKYLKNIKNKKGVGVREFAKSIFARYVRIIDPANLAILKEPFALPGVIIDTNEQPVPSLLDFLKGHGQDLETSGLHSVMQSITKGENLTIAANAAAFRVIVDNLAVLFGEGAKGNDVSLLIECSPEKILAIVRFSEAFLSESSVGARRAFYNKLRNLKCAMIDEIVNEYRPQDGAVVSQELSDQLFDEVVEAKYMEVMSNYHMGIGDRILWDDNWDVDDTNDGAGPAQ